MAQTAVINEPDKKFECKPGNISTIDTIEKIYMTVAKAKIHALQLPKCVGFSLQCDKEPIESKEYLIHFKEGKGTIYDIGKWYTYLLTNNDPSDLQLPVYSLTKRMSVIRGLIADTKEDDKTATDDTLIKTLCLIVVVDAELRPIMEQYKFTQNKALSAKFMNLAIISSGKVKNLTIHIAKVAESQTFKRHYSGYTQASALAALISAFIKPDIVINFGTAGGVTAISKSQYNLVKATTDENKDESESVVDTVEIGDVIFGEACLFLDRLRTKNKNSFDWGLWGGKSMKCKNMIKDLGLVCGIIGSQVAYGVSKLQSEMIRNAGIIACDMECAPIAQILNQTGIKFFPLKVISNGIYPGDSSKNESEYYDNREFVSKKATEVVMQVIEYLNDKRINEL